MSEIWNLKYCKKSNVKPIINPLLKKTRTEVTFCSEEMFQFCGLPLHADSHFEEQNSIVASHKQLMIRMIMSNVSGREGHFSLLATLRDKSHRMWDNAPG